MLCYIHMVCACKEFQERSTYAIGAAIHYLAGTSTALACQDAQDSFVEQKAACQIPAACVGLLLGKTPHCALDAP